MCSKIECITSPRISRQDPRMPSSSQDHAEHCTIRSMEMPVAVEEEIRVMVEEKP